MPFASTKHKNSKIISISDFGVGVDKSAPPEYIPENSLVEAVNFEFDYLSGNLKVRDVLRQIISASFPIDTIHAGLDYFLFSSGINLYKTDLKTIQAIGSLTGDSRPMYCNYKNLTLIASGGKLQKFDGTTLANIEESYPASIVFERHGRVVITKPGDDYIRYSAINNADSWTPIADDTSSGAYEEIGLNDTGDITAVVPLATDLTIFKSSGKVFKVVSEPYHADYAIYEISHNIRNMNNFSALQLGNDVVFVDATGLKTLSTVMEYGDIKSSEEIGKRINKAILGRIDGGARLWNVAPKKQMWLKYSNTNEIYVMNTVTGAFTTFEFSEPINAVVVNGNTVYVAKGNAIYILDAISTVEDGKEISARMRSKKFVAFNEYLIKRVVAKTENVGSYAGTIDIGNIHMQLGIDYNDRLLASIEDLAAECTDYCYPRIDEKIKDTRYNYRPKSVDVTFTSTKGKCSLREIKLEVVEVG